MEIYLVGGAIRDELLGLAVTERDWVVVGSTPKELLDDGYYRVGKDFPVFLHPETHEEYALARTESKSGKGHRGFVVDASKTISLEEDLQRRDLTINAIARDQAGNIIDLVGGISDLKSKVLRHISPAFSDDPLRVLRVARFLARFEHLGFSVSPETKTLMSAMTKAGQLLELTRERVFIELQKALNSASPWKFFELLNEIDALGAIGFADIKLDIAQFRSACELNQDPLVRFACLTANTDVISVKKLGDHLKTPKKYQEVATLTILNYIPWHSIEALSAEAIVEFLYELDAYRRPERFEVLQTCCSTIRQSEGESPGAIVTAWNNCLAATKAISARDIEQGTKGNEISLAIKKLRTQCVASIAPFN
jgi:tRNA nucleotidyltransferase (CCA-adding enzyme)